MKRLKMSTTAVGLVAILFLLVFAFLSYERFHKIEVEDTRDDLERCIQTFHELLSYKGDGFRIENGQLLVGSYVINGNFEVPDKVQELFGETATVFMGDTRVSTNVRHEDGSRAVGTKLIGPAYDAIFKQGKPFRGETLILGLPYLTAYDPIRDNNGKIIGVLYVGMKKTEFLAHYSELKTELALILLGLLATFAAFMFLFDRFVKKAEHKKESDHRFLQTLIDTIPNPVYYKKNDGKFIGGNKSFAKFLGIPIEQLIGKTVFDVLPQAQADHIHKGEMELLQGTELLIDEISIPMNGTCHDVINFNTVCPATEDSPLVIIGTMLDISERKQAEVELREAHQRSLDIIQFYPDATMAIDSGGKVIAWNRAMEELTGVRAEDMLGRGEYEYALPFYGERRPILIDLVANMDGEMDEKYSLSERHGNTFVDETSIKNLRGEERHLHCTATPLRNLSGVSIGAIETLRDISERKRMDKELAKLVRLASLRAEIGGVLGQNLGL